MRRVPALQYRTQIYSADLSSTLFDVFYYGLTTIVAIYGIAAGHKHLACPVAV